MKSHFKKKFKNNKKFFPNQDFKKGGNRNHVGRDKSQKFKAKFDGNCNFCSIYGHKNTECYKKKKEQGGKIDGNCNFYGTYGYRESDCFKKKKSQSGKGSDKSNNFNNKNKNKKFGYVATHYTKSHSNSSDWIIDSGCTNHMCFERAKFENFHKYRKDAVVIGDNSILEVQGIGSVLIQRMILENILDVPKLTMNLLSVIQVARKRYSFEFNSHS